MLYNSQLATPLATSFDYEDGWTNYSSFGSYTQAAFDGVWQLNGLMADEGGDRFTAMSRGSNELRWSGVLPADTTGGTDPGALLVWMRNSEGVGLNRFTLDYWPPGGSVWINAGVTNTVSSTNYVLFSFPLDYSGGAVTLRLHAVSMASPAVYMDDLAVTRYLPWTNTPTAALVSEEPGRRGLGNLSVPLHQQRRGRFDCVDRRCGRGHQQRHLCPGRGRRHYRLCVHGGPGQRLLERPDQGHERAVPSAY